MANFDHFNLIGPVYDLVFGRKKDNEIVELADLQTGQSLLDLGGGTGRVTVLFENISQNLVVADSSLKMLFEAQSKGIKTVHSQSEQLPFISDTFDRIIMVDALHHVKDQLRTLNEMWRLLAPGGKIVIEEPDIRNIVVKLVALGEKLMLMRSHFLSPQKIAEMSQFGRDAVVHIHPGKGIAWIIIEKEVVSN